MPDAFAPGPSHPSNAPLFAVAALLDAERLDCYRIALEFQAIAGQLAPKRRRSPADKAAILDLLGARGLIDARQRNRARVLLVRIVQMLTRLVGRMATASVSRP